jgi:CHAT domain-containing protein/Tfp pilus assembly protein PilF
MKRILENFYSEKSKIPARTFMFVYHPSSHLKSNFTFGTLTLNPISMIRFYCCLPLLLFCFALGGFAQDTKAPIPTSQDPLKDSIDKYAKLGQYAKVVPFAEQWAEKVKKDKGEESAEYGDALDRKGNALYRSGKATEAEPVLIQALEIRKRALGNAHPDVAKTLTNLGNLYNQMGLFPKAESYFLQSLGIQKKTLGEDHHAVAVSLNSLGITYRNMGDYPKAEPYLLQALAIEKKINSSDRTVLSKSLQYLGVLYHDMANYPKAEPYYLQALEINKEELGENHPTVADMLNNLGVLYDDMGNYPKAEPYYFKAFEITKKALGEDHPSAAPPLNNLGNLFDEMGQYHKAEPYKLKALEIEKKTLGDDHPEVAASLNNIGNLYVNMGQYAKAEPFFITALEIRRKKNGEAHPRTASSWESLGVLYKKMGQYAKAEPFYLKSMDIQKKALGEAHPDVASLLASMGQFYIANGQMDKAEIHLLNWNAKKQAQIQRYFPFLSDQDKEKLYESNLSWGQELFKSFCIERYTVKKAIAIELYNDQLATKGLLLNSSAKWKHRIKTSGDKKLFNLYNAWEQNQNKLNRLFQSTDSTERAGIDTVQAQTEKMEKELSLRSENFAKLADKKQVHWKEVQKALKTGEAAIEIIRVKKFGIKHLATDSSDPQKPVYKIKGLTDTIYYAAMIVKPESLIPEMVLLKNGNELEGKYLKFYQNAVSGQLPDNQSYQRFWEKIAGKVRTSSRVYFSPDGVYHKINLNTLFNPKTKKFVLEEKDIRLVTVTKDIVNPGPAEENNKLAELVGFPSYYANSPTASVSTTNRKSPEMSYGLRLESLGTLADLPGTKVEVDKIASILDAGGWEVKSHTGAGALEQNIKESYKPRLLHIATHGFFQADTTNGSSPLLRSGLMLTGAGSTLKGEKNETGEDGILTAYEAMNLNLDNTDLVVLSACETGLGEIKNGEGVYGLQRAFKVAGAKTIIMSLWKVSDQATQELMVSFYKHWLSMQNIGKRAAFLAAQKELKAKYPNPYFWGAFVMVGE